MCVAENVNVKCKKFVNKNVFKNQYNLFIVFCMGILWFYKCIHFCKICRLKMARIQAVISLVICRLFGVIYLKIVGVNLEKIDFF